jgi:glyceraldehyde 3-phosphate dehydrogenase
MKRIKVGINGFGRIGRAIYKINYQKKLFDVVAINDINPDNHNLAYLLQYDSTYGRFPEKVKDTKNSLRIGKKTVGIHHAEAISDVPWEDYKIDIVIDSSGIKNNLLHLKDLKSKVKNVVVTYDPGEDAQTIIFGVNENKLNPRKNFLLSASICDACALGPVIKVVESGPHKIISGFVTTLHSWLTYQNLLDGPSKSWSQPGDVYSHYALGRSSPMNIIPKSTSAVLATNKVIPNLSDRITSFSFRVPTNAVVSSVLTFVLNKPISKESLIKKFELAEKKQKNKVIKNSIEPLTSIDYIGEEYSTIIDHRWTSVNNRNHVKLLYWYDNEWGYSSRVVDLIAAISKKYAHE